MCLFVCLFVLNSNLLHNVMTLEELRYVCGHVISETYLNIIKKKKEKYLILEMWQINMFEFAF